jgi:peroxiredoxin Q/BCP
MVANQYKQEVNLLRMGRMPALLVIDKAGRIRYAHYGHSMSDIPDNREILDLLKTLNSERG